MILLYMCCDVIRFQSVIKRERVFFNKHRESSEGCSES